jgi:LPS sulfotransferase NodH
MICTTPRSGSNYLGQIFESTGVLGRPREYFNGPARRVLDDLAYPDDVEAQIERVLTDGATANGVYALKLFPDQFRQASARVRVVERLPNLSFVRLRRRDILGQAISWSRALQTEQYRSTQTVKGAATYDARLIIQRIVEIARFEAAWDIYFARLSANPLRLEYETVVSDPAAAAQALAAQLQLNEPISVNAARIDLRIQRDDETSVWRERFTREHGDANVFYTL